MQKEPSYSISSSGFWKEFGYFPRVLNNRIHVPFQQHGEQWEKNACTACACQRGEVRCVRETCGSVTCEKVLKNHTSDTPAAPSAVPRASDSPAHCWVVFLGGEQGAAPREVLWGVCVFQRQLLGRWHHQVPRRDVEQHPLWLLRVPGGASHLPGSWVCQSGVCQGEKGFLLPRWMCQVLGFFFPLPFSFFLT